jgi:hypothetical protein
MYNRGQIRTFWNRTKRLESLGFPEELYLPRGRHAYWAEQDFLTDLTINEGVLAFAFLRPTLKDKCFFTATGSIYTVREGGRLDGTLSEGYNHTWVRFKFPNTRYAGLGHHVYAAQEQVGFYGGSTIPLNHQALNLAAEAIRLVGDIGRKYLTTDWVSPVYPIEPLEQAV